MVGKYLNELLKQLRFKTRLINVLYESEKKDEKSEIYMHMYDLFVYDMRWLVSVRTK